MNSLIECLQFGAVIILAMSAAILSSESWRGGDNPLDASPRVGVYPGTAVTDAMGTPLP
jgi:hypothetical protein